MLHSIPPLLDDGLSAMPSWLPKCPVTTTTSTTTTSTTSTTSQPGMSYARVTGTATPQQASAKRTAGTFEERKLPRSLRILLDTVDADEVVRWLFELGPGSDTFECNLKHRKDSDGNIDEESVTVEIGHSRFIDSRIVDRVNARALEAMRTEHVLYGVLKMIVENPDKADALAQAALDSRHAGKLPGNADG